MTSHTSASEQAILAANNSAACCKFCGLMICGPTTIWNSYEQACKCSVAERKQLTEEDIRKIIREELARFKADTTCEPK